MGKKKNKEKAMDYLSLDESAWKMFEAMVEATDSSSTIKTVCAVIFVIPLSVIIFYLSNSKALPNTLWFSNFPSLTIILPFTIVVSTLLLNV